MIDTETKARLLAYQRNELTEHQIYLRLSELQPNPENRRVLAQIAADEKRHAEIWRGYTGQDVSPDWQKVFVMTWLCRILGFTFVTKLMERGEAHAQESYAHLPDELAHSHAIAQDENSHENALLGMLDEERLQYIGSIVLGLNDALVELTGALAGLTLALQNPRLIAMTGWIIGIAAALSMAASEYLSTKIEGKRQHPLRAALYTGIAYILTVILLAAPYLIFQNVYAALLLMLGIAVGIIALFNFYFAVAKDQPFFRRFLEMVVLSLSVAAISFLVGFLMRTFTGIEI